MTQHDARVIVDHADAHGFPYRPACSCGWVYARRYVVRSAALGMAAAHADGSLDRPAVPMPSLC